MAALMQLLQSVAELMRCNRRCQMGSNMRGSTKARVLGTKAAFSKKQTPKGDFSNASTTDGSDSEASTVGTHSSAPVQRPAPGLALPGHTPPPGLGLPTRGNTGPCVANDAPSALEDVLKKLSPEDAATVKHYFAQRNGMASKYGTPQQKPQASPIVRQPSAVDIALDPEKSLRANLQKMALIDPSCIITVRKINKLGLTSPYALKAYFKQFGPVEEVFVTHAVAKPNYEGEKMRMRPAGMGFVAFAKAEDALAVLNEQREHVIRGTSISVCTYEPRPAKEVRAS